MEAGWGQQERRLAWPRLGNGVEGRKPEVYFKRNSQEASLMD